MISDVLFDAIDQIKGYQQHLPHVYEDLEKQINLVVAAMDWLRAELDKAPEAEAGADVDLEVLRDGPDADVRGLYPADQQAESSKEDNNAEQADCPAHHGAF